MPDPDDAYDDKPDRYEAFARAVERYLKDHPELEAEWRKRNPDEEPTKDDLLDLAAEKVERLFADGI